MTSREIYYIIHNLEDNSVSIEATNKQNAGDVYKMEISSNNNVEMPATLYSGIPADCITSLTLAHCQLRNLPNALFAPNLKELNLSNNFLSELPDWITKCCVKLQTINLSHNKLHSFHIPKCCRELRSIDVSHNNLSIIPMWIFSASCCGLETLDISANPLQKYLVPLRGRCLKSLRVLHMNNCNFMSDYMRIVREIPRLKVFSISNTLHAHLNSIQDLPFQTFYSVSSLTEVNLSGLAIASLTDEISCLTTLEKLNISHNHLSWLPDSFTGLSSLKVLDASHNDLVHLPDDIGKLESLCELYIANNIIGSLPQSIKNLQKLVTLDCYNTDLTLTAWELVNEMPNIQALDLEQNSFQTSGDEQYAGKRDKLRRNTNKVSRENGSKYEVCDASDEANSLKSVSSYCSEENEVIEAHNFVEEEGWDTESYDTDDYLVLPPFKFIIVPKRKHYDPSDYIDPVCFEDAANDNT